LAEELSCLPLKIKTAVPIKPINTPINWLLLNERPSAINPINKVFNGVNEFKIEQTELLTLVSAIANKNAGIKVPNNEVIAIYFHWYSFISVRLLNPIINKKIEVKIILKAPNWYGDKPISPFFMRINELPHIKESTTNKVH
jgi:hypothetical protein